MQAFRTIPILLLLTALLVGLGVYTLIGSKLTGEPREFPAPIQSSAFKETEFLPALESPMNSRKNQVYAASLLFAWDKLKDELGAPLLVAKASTALYLISQSTAHLDTLNPDEYESSAGVEGNRVKARAAFSKSLPFATVLQGFNNELVFNKTKVDAFGMKDFDAEIAQSITILYYKSNDDFIIRLSPSNKQHEILLQKSRMPKFSTLAASLTSLNEKIKLGQQERKDHRQQWRYNLSYQDVVIIPKFKFNIEHNYSDFAGTTLTCNSRLLIIDKVTQRTAFLLDERGAKIEGTAAIEAAAEALEDETTPKPKRLVFDQPFLLAAKRVSRRQPYFVMWTANAELMQQNKPGKLAN